MEEGSHIRVEEAGAEELHSKLVEEAEVEEEEVRRSLQRSPTKG